MRLRFFVACFLLVALTTCPTGHVYCSTELIRNGGFDEGINYWSRPGTEAAVSDAYAHAGRYSLRVANSSAWQNIQLEGASSVDLNLSFWVYLFNPAAISGKTVAAITVSLITPTATRGLSYYVTPSKSQETDVTAVMIPDLKPNLWNNVKRSFDDDFKKAYPNFELKNVRELKITAWSLNTTNPTPFWDDISLTYEKAPATTPPPKTPTPSPTTTPSPTPTPTTKPEAEGKILFQSDRDGNYELYTMNADGSGVTRLTNDSAEDISAVWSPDGKRITFRSTRHDPRGEIYVVNANGSGVTRLTRDPAAEDLPSWSPDGKKIAFESNRTGAIQIYVMNTDGSEVTRLMTSSATDGTPRWSPDGKRIAFHSNRDGNWEVYTVNADGSQVTRITNNPAIDLFPSWSPNGSKIAFQTNRDGNFEIYTIKADISDLTRITNNKAYDGWSSWSPDGKTIAFQSNRDGNWEIYLTSSDGSSIARITDTKKNNGYPVWQPTPSTSVTTSGVAWKEEYTLPALAIVVFGALAGGLLVLRKRRSKTQEAAPSPPPIQRPSGQVAEATYCISCGAQLAIGTRFCTKCGSSQ